MARTAERLATLGLTLLLVACQAPWSVAPAATPTAPVATPSASPVVTPASGPDRPPSPAVSALPTTALAAVLGEVGPIPQPQPIGPLPEGWQVYRGTKLPFVMAYPPDWTADDSADGAVYFRAPGDSATWLLIGTTGEVDRRTRDELRDEYYQSAFCMQKGIDVTRDNIFSDITFASVGLTCDQAGGLHYIYAGIGHYRLVPWRFRVEARYDRYNAHKHLFVAMLASLNIYANP